MTIVTPAAYRWRARRPGRPGRRLLITPARPHRAARPPPTSSARRPATTRRTAAVAQDALAERRHVDRPGHRLRPQLVHPADDPRRADGLEAGRRAPTATTWCPTWRRRSRPPTDGGKTYTFTLRNGIKFSTGGEVEAQRLRLLDDPPVQDPRPRASASTAASSAATRCISDADVVRPVARASSPTTQAGTVTFHLTAPDPDFLQKLALPFAYVVPTGTRPTDTGTTPMPGTGPYMIQS